MAWCATNAVIKHTGTGMMIERDASGAGKVDPLVATFDAAVVMGFNPEANAPPEYQIMFV
jgi:phage terminase large subunit-like protein